MPFADKNGLAAKRSKLSPLLSRENKQRLRQLINMRKWRKKMVNAGAYRKGGKYYREYEPVRDAPRRRKYYLAMKARRGIA